VLAHAGGADETLSVVLLFAGLWIGWAGWSRLKGKGFPRLPIRGAYALIGVGLVVAVSAAVIPRMIFGPTLTPAGASPAAVRPSSTATIGFSRPSQGAMARGDTLEVVMTLTGGTIVDATSTTLTPDTGHVHLSVDRKLVSMTYGLVQEIPLAGLVPGPHTLEAEYVAADHGPFDPPVTATVDFTIAPGSGG
jgi:hypothetical protein